MRRPPEELRVSLAPKSVADVLARFPKETLERMKAKAQRDLASARERLAFAELEQQQIAEAIAGASRPLFSLDRDAEAGDTVELKWVVPEGVPSSRYRIVVARVEDNAR